MATLPPLLAHLVDSATTDLDSGHALTDAVEEHRDHVRAWYGGLMGLLVVRASAATDLVRHGAVNGLAVAVVADTGIDHLTDTLATLRGAGAPVHRVESAVAKRGEDPLPGLARLLVASEQLREADPAVVVHAEIPLTGGLHDALDALAQASGPAAATFRIGGLAGELFPPAPVLAGVICACRDRGVRFSINAGLERGLRHNDHETGFAHHGVLNLLAACVTAGRGANQAAVADRLSTNDPAVLTETILAAGDTPRPLWTAYTTDRVDDIVHDLTLYEVMSRDPKPDASGSELSRTSDNAVS